MLQQRLCNNFFKAHRQTRPKADGTKPKVAPFLIITEYDIALKEIKDLRTIGYIRFSAVDFKSGAICYRVTIVRCLDTHLLTVTDKVAAPGAETITKKKMLQL